MTKNMICFDLDGTLADLYNVPDWLPKLRAEDASPYIDAKPIYNMKRLNKICGLLQKAGYEIQIITALSKGASPEYKKAIRAAKLAWLDKWGFVYDHFHGVDYTTNKSKVIYRDLREGGHALLVDDEERHIKAWKWGETLKPDENLLAELANLLPKDLREEL